MQSTSQAAGFFAIVVLASLPAWAAQSAILKNGFSIRYERQEPMGLMTRLYTTRDGSSFVDVPTSNIDHIEAAADEAASVIQKQGSPSQAAKPDLNANSNKLVRKQAPPIDLNQLVASTSGAYQLDPDLVNSVIRAESGFNVRAVSPRGAQGLMQLMPQTASQLGVQNAFDPQANVEGGTRYLRELLERYNFDLIKALAAYNAGPERVEQYGGVPPYYETKAYVARIVRDFNRKKLAAKHANSAAQKTQNNSASKRASISQSQTTRKIPPAQSLAAN